MLLTSMFRPAARLRVCLLPHYVVRAGWGQQFKHAVDLCETAVGASVLLNVHVSGADRVRARLPLSTGRR